MTFHPEDLFDLFAPRGADRIDVAELAALHAARSLELATGRGARGLVHIGDLSPAQTVFELLRLAALGQRLLDEAAERPRAALEDAVAKAREADATQLAHWLNGTAPLNCRRAER